MRTLQQDLSAAWRSRFFRVYRTELRQGYQVAFPVMAFVGGLLGYAGVPLVELLATYGMLLASLPLLAFPVALTSAKAQLTDEDLRCIARRRLMPGVNPGQGEL